MKTGLFIFASPLYKYENTLYYDDAAHQNTVELCSSMFDELLIVARCRQVRKQDLIHKRLSDTGARFVLELPDFGIGGYKGWLNSLKLFSSLQVYASLKKLIHSADFVYTEAPSLEGLLSALGTINTGRSLTFETRGEALLNPDYMFQRFGRKGLVYTKIFERTYKIIRKRSRAGLFVSPNLMQRYPVVNGYQAAISDVRLPQSLLGKPRYFEHPASRFVYVGHLEKIKRVDLILRAFHIVRDRLPSGWQFNIIGNGPEMPALQSLVQELGFESNVQFRGRIAWGEALFEFYHKSDVLLMASTSEGASRTLIEGMACGLPIISTAVGTAPELLDPSVIVPVDNLAKYAETLACVAMKPEILTKLALQNQNSVQCFYPSVLYEQRKNFFSQAIQLSQQEKTIVAHS